MKLLNKFIWEKSHLNNKGISLKFSTSRYCYIKPTMCNTWSNLHRKPWYDKPYESYYVCTEKVFYWLWFRLKLKVEKEFLSVINDDFSTDDFFQMLPPFLNIDGELYHFNMIQGKHGYKITYKKNDSEGGDVLKSGNAYNLRHLLVKMVTWLQLHDYVKYMPYGYKEKYEIMFKTKIEHSRGFDK